MNRSQATALTMLIWEAAIYARGGSDLFALVLMIGMGALFIGVSKP